MCRIARYTLGVYIYIALLHLRLNVPPHTMCRRAPVHRRGLSPHASWLPNVALARIVRGIFMEGDMHQDVPTQTNDKPDPDHLTTIFVWLESDDDAPADEPQELTVLYPDLPG